MGAAKVKLAKDTLLLPFQEKWVKDRSRLKIAEKSRQIGWTWCLKLMEEKSAAAKAAIEAATSKAKAGGGISEETLRELEEAAKLL